MIAQDSLDSIGSLMPAVCSPHVARSCFAAAVFMHYARSSASKIKKYQNDPGISSNLCMCFISAVSARWLNAACLEKELSHLLHLATLANARAAQRVDWAVSVDICVRICANRVTAYDHWPCNQQILQTMKIYENDGHVYKENVAQSPVVVSFAESHITFYVEFQYVFSTYTGGDNLARLLSNYKPWLSKRWFGLGKYVFYDVLQHVTTKWVKICQNMKIVSEPVQWCGEKDASQKAWLWNGRPRLQTPLLVANPCLQLCKLKGFVTSINIL